MSRPVILDVDTGVDDSVAILLAMRLPQLDVKTVTTVSGNVHVDEVVESTKVVLGLTDYKGVRLGKGSSVSIRRTRFHAPEVHGRDGLGNMRNKYKRFKADIRTERAVPLIIETVKNSRQPVTVIATGPLTNIAHAIKRDKRSMQRVKGIVSMGGSFGYRGNTGPLAEFNYFVDPYAAEIVAQSGIPLTIVPLNVTEKVPLSRTQVIDWAEKSSSILSGFISDVTKFYMNYHKKAESFNGGFMHDPLTVALVADRSIIKKQGKHPFLIETEGNYTAGTTLNTEARGRERKAPKVSVITEVDTKKFWELFRETLFPSSDI